MVKVRNIITLLFYALSMFCILGSVANFNAAEAQSKVVYLEGINFKYPDSSSAKVDVVISADNTFDYKTFKLSANEEANKPNRFVLDVLNSKPKFYIDDDFQRIFKKDKIINLIRVGKNHKEYTRIVFDLKQTANAQITEQVTQSGNHLLIISFSPINNRFTAQDEEGFATLITPEGSKQVSLSNEENIIKSSSKKKIKVVLDPGHGGRDPGAVSNFQQIQEKNINYSIARKIKRIMNKDANFDAILTRDSDVLHSLSKRIKISHEHAADIFISIHADSFPGNTEVNGASVYVLAEKEASNQIARLLAKRENQVDEQYGIQDVGEIKNKDTQFIVRDLQRKSVDNASNQLAKSVLKEMKKVKTLFAPSPQKGPFAVLKSSYAPSILIELGFLSNTNEARTLVDDAHQNKLAKAIYTGVKNYVKNHSQFNFEHKKPSKKSVKTTKKKVTVKTKPKKKVISSKQQEKKKKSLKSANKKPVKAKKAPKKIIPPKPEPKYIRYIVQENDTFDSIGLTHGITQEKLKKLNPKFQGLIFPGDELLIPTTIEK
jgi:N-acetylmuramoyl-L-alanine amidase